MLNALKWMNVKQGLQMNTIQFIQKIKTGDGPKYLIEQIRYVRETQSYHLRNENQLQNTKNNHNQYANVTTIPIKDCIFTI